MRTIHGQPLVKVLSLWQLNRLLEISRAESGLGVLLQVVLLAAFLNVLSRFESLALFVSEEKQK